MTLDEETAKSLLELMKASLFNRNLEGRKVELIRVEIKLDFGETLILEKS